MPFAMEQDSLTLYADDSTLYYAAATCSELNQVLTRELYFIYDWVKPNKLVLNISKTVCMLFGSNHSLKTDHKLDQPMQQVRRTKLLGLWLNCSLTLSEHIYGTNYSPNMGRAVAITRKCASFPPPSLWNQIVHVLVLCHLDYCSVVWASALKEQH